MLTVRAPDPLSHAIALRLGIRDDETRSTYETAELNYLEALYLDLMATAYEGVDGACLTGAAESGSSLHSLSRKSRVETELGLNSARADLIEAILEGDGNSNRGPSALLEDFTRNLTAYIDSLAETITTMDPPSIIERESKLIELSF